MPSRPRVPKSNFRGVRGILAPAARGASSGRSHRRITQPRNRSARICSDRAGSHGYFAQRKHASGRRCFLGSAPRQPLPRHRPRFRPLRAPANSLVLRSRPHRRRIASLRNPIDGAFPDTGHPQPTSDHRPAPKPSRPSQNSPPRPIRSPCSPPRDRQVIVRGRAIVPGTGRFFRTNARREVSQSRTLPPALIGSYAWRFPSASAHYCGATQQRPRGRSTLPAPDHESCANITPRRGISPKWVSAQSA
jgi:hypothetical protein